MALPVMPRWLAPVLVVIFALLTVWAAYNVSHLASASAGPAPTGPQLSYASSGVYSYDAALAPNTLFNSTNVSGSNLTLFTSITRWVNVSVVSSVALDAVASGRLTDRFTVVLSTDDWSKTLVNSSQTNASPSATAFAVTDRYALNVSSLEAYVGHIDAQLNYTAASFTVTLLANVSGEIGYAGGSGSLGIAPHLNLTFLGPLITPSGTTIAANGTVTGASTGGDPASAPSPDLAYLELAGAVGALAISLWLLFAARRAAASPLPSLAHLIEPYNEVIARTTRPPVAVATLSVAGWEDLVKVADTLGRPILRPPGGPSDPDGSAFYVIDGAVAYVYHYPRSAAQTGASRPKGSAAGTSPTAARPGSSPSSAPQAGAKAAAVPPPSPSAPATPPSPGATAGPAPPPPPSPTVSVPTPSRSTVAPYGFGVTPSPTARPARLLAAQLARIRSASLTPPQLWYAYSLYSQTALAVVSAQDADQAKLAVENFRRALDGILPASPSAPSGS